MPAAPREDRLRTSETTDRRPASGRRTTPYGSALARAKTPPAMPVSTAIRDDVRVAPPCLRDVGSGRAAPHAGQMTANVESASPHASHLATANTVLPALPADGCSLSENIDRMKQALARRAHRRLDETSGSVKVARLPWISGGSGA